MSTGGRAAGTWVVLVLVGLGLILAIIGVRYRQWTPNPATTRPTTGASTGPTAGE